MRKELVAKIQMVFSIQLDKNIFGMIYTQIHSITVKGVEVVLWPKNQMHPNWTTLPSLASCVFGDKILADMSGPFKTDSQGHRYCVMVIESSSMHVILIPLKSVSTEAVASALYTYVVTKNGVCNTILLTDSGNPFRSALVKAIAEICMV